MKRWKNRRRTRSAPIAAETTWLRVARMERLAAELKQLAEEERAQLLLDAKRGLDPYRR